MATDQKLIYTVHTLEKTQLMKREGNSTTITEIEADRTITSDKVQTNQAEDKALLIDFSRFYIILTN